MSRPDRARLLELAREWRRRADRCPLSRARLWMPRCPDCAVELVQVAGLHHRCPDCGADLQRTSQRGAVLDLLTEGRPYGFLLGGNRSGKSEAGAQVDVAFALGREHPAVVEWCAGNGIPGALVPSGPGMVWAVALDSADSRRYVRPKIAAYLPEGSRWRNREGDGEATVDLPNGGRVVFKQVSQGRDGFQGDAVRRVRFDEEPGDLAVVEEADMRLVDEAGRMWFTMSPLSGWTPLLERHARTPQADTTIRNLDGTHNPHVPAAELERRLARAGALAAARRDGTITSLEGLVHPEWRRAVHVVPAFRPPAGWPRFAAIDFGYRAPFVHVWAALDTDADTLHVYREHYQAEQTIGQHAAAIWAAEACPVCRPNGAIGSPAWWAWRVAGGEGLAQAPDAQGPCRGCGGTGNAEPRPLARLADPEAASDRATLAELGIATVPARKDRRPSYEALCDRLAVVGGVPGLVVHDCCSRTIAEMERLRWATDEVTGKADKQLLVRGDDHAWDTLRYLAFGVRLLGYGTQRADWEDVE